MSIINEDIDPYLTAAYSEELSGLQMNWRIPFVYTEHVWVILKINKIRLELKQQGQILISNKLQQ